MIAITVTMASTIRTVIMMIITFMVVFTARTMVMFTARTMVMITFMTTSTSTTKYKTIPTIHI
ncbi:hypothetical protein PQ796_00235 (plasmid) [Priestia megaterium]|uniref:hypothetical protein n=1 Tax=Priestia megaterium TaxID=1404 RepID=UPI002449080C|nr:hypothetical protein [Priestia megaterium]MDH2449032.1 hypothetical protein [Priestia megaterium]MDL5148490.1 hypothetical protein [Priestia megaterium]